MGRREIAKDVCITALMGGGIAALIGSMALPAGSPYFDVLIYLGSAGIIAGFIGLLYLWLTPPRAERGNGMGKDDKDDGLTGPTGIYIGPGSKRARLINNKIHGFERGIVDHGEDTAMHGNELTGPEQFRPPMAAPQQEQPRRRKLFGGFSFSKGDHLRK